MINIIYGKKGTGKTKIIIDKANESVEAGYAHTVFLTDTNRYSSEIKIAVRFINGKSCQVRTPEELIGFIAGIVASNNDVKYVFIDGVTRLTNVELKELAGFFKKLEKIAFDNKLEITFTISASKEEMPDFIRKYIRD